MGALLNQTMFLILIGLLKGRTYAQIAQSFHDVSIGSRIGIAYIVNHTLGTLQAHLGFVQSLAHRQLLLYYLLPCRAANDLPQLLWSTLEYLSLSCCATIVVQQ